MLKFIRMDATVALWLQLSIIIFGLFVSSGQCHKSDAFQSTLGHIKSDTSPEIQTKAAKDVAERLLGKEISKLFIMMLDTNLGPIGKDTFAIRKNDLDEIEIRGTSGVAITWGLHFYLKHYCNVHISWDGAQITLPKKLPKVQDKIISNDRFRYYQNVCTVGYSSAWWQWEQWERNIDWMALNGINLALAFTAQEAIWQRLYQELNLTKEEIDEHLGGPAFLPWTRMGNIRGFGGPLSTNWHNRTIRLQHQILRRMRDLGIVPVLPAFAGHVPRAFARLFPDANMTKIDPWNKFKDKYCCPYLLEPMDPLFRIIGEKFLKMYIDEFGTDHIYNCDTFNENEPGSTELIYLKNVGQEIFAAMNAVDSKAIWLLQAWLFVHDFNFWTKPRVKSFLTSVPTGRMLILDLQSEQFPQYSRLNSYYGQPFIWCMLHNFGGTLGMFGSAEIINQRGTSFVASPYIGGRQTIREAFIRKEVPLESVDILIASLSESSLRQYESALKKWWTFCAREKIDPFTGSTNNVLSFLTEEFKKSASLSSLNCYRSAISLILGSEFGKNEKILRFFRGVAKLRPAAPRYDSTWDPHIVLKYLSSWYPNEEINLECLTLKLVTLLALVTGHRMQTLSLIDMRNIYRANENSLEIKIPDTIKTSGPNKKQPVLRLPFFIQDNSICAASVLLLYLEKTKDLRGSVVKLFISFKKPYKAVGTQTLSRWIKTAMSKSGIDVNIFSAYSTRHAATSAAKRQGVSIDLIRKTAGWSKYSETFARFYDRCVFSENAQFAEAVLETEVLT